MGQAWRPDGSSARGSIAGKLAGLTRRAWACYWTRRASHATVAILHALDDRALKDIGLDRSEIESVVYGDRKGGGCGAVAGARPPFSERRVCMC